MSEETLLTAARRLVRFVRVDNGAHGGLISMDTTQAVETLAIQVQQETARLKREEEATAWVEVPHAH